MLTARKKPQQWIEIHHAGEVLRLRVDLVNSRWVQLSFDDPARHFEIDIRPEKSAGSIAQAG